MPSASCPYPWVNCRHIYGHKGTKGWARQGSRGDWVLPIQLYTPNSDNILIRWTHPNSTPRVLYFLGALVIFSMMMTIIFIIMMTFGVGISAAATGLPLPRAQNTSLRWFPMPACNSVRGGPVDPRGAAQWLQRCQIWFRWWETLGNYFYIYGIFHCHLWLLEGKKHNDQKSHEES